MKIALASNNFPPEFQGGTERVTLALASALAELGDDVFVVTGSERPHEGDDVIEEDVAGLTVLRVPRLPDEVYGLELRRPRLMNVVESLLVERGAEVLHLHHWANLSIELLRRAERRGIPSIATLHDMWTTCPRFFRQPPDGLTCPDGDGREPCGRCVALSIEQPLWKLRLGVANRDREILAELHTARRVTAPSASCAQSIAAHVPWPEPIEVVPHGLLENVSAEVRFDGEPRTPFRVGTFGNLVRSKGVATLVEAMRGVDGAELHLFGKVLEEGLEGELRDLAERGGVTMVNHGWFDAGDRHPARELDLAVFPSQCVESYGLVVEEALARGVPVVVSDLGALSERIGDGGIVTPAGDAETLRATLQSVVSEPGRYAELVRGIPREFATIRDAAMRYREMYQAAVEVSV